MLILIFNTVKIKLILKSYDLLEKLTLTE